MLIDAPFMLVEKYTKECQFGQKYKPKVPKSRLERNEKVACDILMHINVITKLYRIS